MVNCLPLLLFNVGNAKSDIDLRKHTLYISYLNNGNYRLSNAVDRDPSTIIHTSFIPYLDNGFEWLLIKINSNMFQMVQSLRIMKRIGELNTNIIQF